ncbi:type I-E CRISPR-associated protein Cas5/CasD [Salinibacter ruber]|uniref:type I-E CRISPR-associated protein Cas5/CasD n=1 Tax=Salinibacter ruber TaxID=146919 RepID=UPI002168D76F|nr:type I-E CRISPR-associated protein Cas5/CasD [Salinibacter ruber]MCS4054092.1 CRISPR system Cascade subunit CasD [Salinibacter ruber]
MIKLTFDAPLMSFGGPAVDQVGNTFHFPPRSMLTGLFGAAIGYDRSEHEKLQALQEAFSYGVREDRQGHLIEDFQTVDLETPWMTGYWKNGQYVSGKEARGRYDSSSANRETLHKQYVADAVYTVVVSISDEVPIGGEVPTGDEEKLLDALRAPKWPVYVGRKACGTGYLRPEQADYPDLKTALQKTELHDAADMEGPYRIWTEGHGRAVAGLRDWETRVHAGEQWIEEDTVDVT